MLLLELLVIIYYFWKESLHLSWLNFWKLLPSKLYSRFCVYAQVTTINSINFDFECKVFTHFWCLPKLLKFEKYWQFSYHAIILMFFVSNVFYYQLTAFLNFKLLLTPSKHRPINRILKHIISSKWQFQSCQFEKNNLFP